MRLNEFTEQSVQEDSGYNGSEPLDLSKSPSVNDVFKRALYIYDYEDYGNDGDYSEDDAIDQYVESNFGENVLDQLNKARYQSYFGRDGGNKGGHIRSSNLGTAGAPSGNFRTTKAGKMHSQDVKMTKNKIADRLGRHPEPALPEATELVSSPYGTDRSGIFSPNRGIARRSLTAVDKVLQKPLITQQNTNRINFLLDLVPDRKLKELYGVLAYEHFPFDDLRDLPWFMKRLNLLIARAEQILSQEQGVAEAMRNTDDPYDDMVEDYLDYLESVGMIRNSREEEKAEILADLDSGVLHSSEIEYALSGTKWDPLGQQGVAEDGKQYDHRDPEHHDLDVARPLIYGLKINGKIWKKDGNTVTFFTKERAVAAKNSMLNKKPELEITLVQRPQD